MKKIIKFMTNPINLVIIWFIYLLSPIVSVLRYFYIIKTENSFTLIRAGLSFLRYSFKYLIFFLFLVFLICWVKKYFFGFLTFKRKLALIIIASTSLIANLIGKYLINLELNNYANYLYSQIGLTIIELKSMMAVNSLVFISIIAFLISSYKLSVKIGATQSVLGIQPKQRKLLKKIDLILYIVAIIGLLLILSEAIYPFSNLGRILKSTKETYNEKLGAQYKYLPPLTQITPQESVIIHPPQGVKWPAIGNQPVIRYFLYPRILISGALLKDNRLIQEIHQAYFVEIDPNFIETHWPIINEDLKKIIFDEKNEVSYISLERVYDIDDIRVYKITF